jgi:hypothetical protein
MKRVRRWMADLTDRRADRWGDIIDRLRARRGRVGERFSVGWYRFTDPVGLRWSRLTDSNLAPRARLSGYRTERDRVGVPRRSPIMLVASLFVVLLSWSVTMAVVVRGRTVPPSPRAAASVEPSRASARGIDVPDVRDMPASDARTQLERAGLKFAGARAAVGTPGQVLRTQPTIGRPVPPDTPVTIVVGVEAERIILETGAGSQTFPALALRTRTMSS